MEGMQLVKAIVVKGKMVSLVVKPQEVRSVEPSRAARMD